MDFEVESLDNAFFGFGVEDARKPYVSCRGCLAGPLFIVSASRSPPGLDSKGSTFGANFRLAPKRVDFWGSFSHSGDSFVLFLAYFSIIGSTLAALGAHFLITKTVWTTKGAPRGISPDISSLFGSNFEAIFKVFFDF